jgi:uncharacterized membrane protein YgdD (TMEM256/DUF423 family)
MNPERLFAAAGAISGLIAVALGAFGAHGLRQRLSPEMLAVFETGVRYQVYHALALFAVAWAVSRWTSSPQAAWAGWLFIAGTVIFSGSLYILATSGVRWLGAITPVGGICFLAGWLSLVWAALGER